MRTLAIVGVGLIGGSIALAARARGVADRILAVDSDPQALEVSRLRCRLDDCVNDVSIAVEQAEMTVVCTPVDRIVELVLAAAQTCPGYALITDVGSTKSAIVRGVHEKLPRRCCFVGSHPVAGSEKRGAGFAHERLFEGRVVVVTPTEDSDRQALKRTVDFWTSLGASVVEMSPEDHDRALAYTSHLPHVIAAALAGMLPHHWRELTSSGFADSTRIAGGDPSVWTPICLQNRDAILQSLTTLEGGLEDLRAALERADSRAIDEFLMRGKRSRDALGS